MPINDLTNDDRQAIRLRFAEGGTTIAELARQYNLDYKTVRRIVKPEGKLKPGPLKGNQACSEAGRRGGLATKEKFGPEHFRSIGGSGGHATNAKYGEEFYRSIGRTGGSK